MNGSPPRAPAQAPTDWKAVFCRRPVSVLVASGLGAGFLPKAPGTYGSLLGVLGAEAVHARWGLTGLASLALGATVFGTVASELVERAVGRHDPQEVVVDEVAGQALALLLLHAGMSGRALASPAVAWVLVAVAFGLFRLLDIAKPGPIGNLQRLPGGFGIMADDLLAGLVAGLVAAGAALALSRPPGGG